MPTQSDITHLLRRTEFVARPARVTALMAKPSLAAAVADILAVPANPGTVTFSSTDQYVRGSELVAFWLDRMAFGPKPMQEHMALFWHGHFCSSQRKVQIATRMRDQIDLFRTAGLSDLGTLLKRMAVQPAMLRYLDNAKNKATSPNQNFARELMELFVLGVGNYSEADVEASTLAWTGHSIDSTTMNYVWRPDWHNGSHKTFLGRTINTGTNPTHHAYDTIDVMLGAGVVPASAVTVLNRGLPTRQVAADFISRKLWAEFAGTSPPAAVIAAMRATAIATNFAIKPWLTTMLTRPEFYAMDVRTGLVRSPVAYSVAMMAATGQRSDAVSVRYLQAAGQRPLYPPDVSGWKTNRYWVNAGAMAARATIATAVAKRAQLGYWNGDGLIHLAGGTLSHAEVTGTYADRPADLVRRILSLMHVKVATPTFTALVNYATAITPPERNQLVRLILTCPDMHLA